MRKVDIKIGDVYEVETHQENAGSVRAARFSASVHKNDDNLKEGNSTQALEWARGFWVK